MRIKQSSINQIKIPGSSGIFILNRRKFLFDPEACKIILLQGWGAHELPGTDMVLKKRVPKMTFLTPFVFLDVSYLLMLKQVWEKVKWRLREFPPLSH